MQEGVLTRFPPNTFNPFFVLFFMFIWVVFGLLSFIFILAIAGASIQSRAIITSLSIVLSLLLTHILFRLLKRIIKASRENMAFEPIPFYQLMLIAIDILGFIALVLNHFFKTNVNFEESRHYNEWIAAVTVLCLFLIGIFGWAALVIINIHFKT
jgi:hypothetical protein